MKLIITGNSQLRPTLQFLTSAIAMLGIHQGGPITEIVSQSFTGVDAVGEEWASEWRCRIKRYWEAPGKTSKPAPYAEMAAYADALLLIWDGEARGSNNLKREMERLKKPIYEVILRSWGNK